MRYLRTIIYFFSKKKRSQSLFATALKEGAEDFSKEMGYSVRPR
ncbi:MAG: hypothetical protein ACXVBJ_02020 [Flavisolibacter sp.]